MEMELLKPAIKKNLLEESIEHLHQQSYNWQNQIAFWKDENRFFNDLLSNKLFHNVTPLDKKIIKDTLNNISLNDLEKLQKEVTNHEKTLYAIILNKNKNVYNYRHVHKELEHKFIELEKRIKDLKTAVFELVKIVNANFYDSNETIHTIYERRSVRKFKNYLIDKLHIQQILRAGTMAPSAMNNQPWKFYILTNSEKIKNYSDEIAKVASNIHQFSLKDKLNNYDPIFHGAPVVIFITSIRYNEWAAVDVGCCAQNIMLTAKSLGYDSCLIGLAKYIENTTIYDQLNIPKEEKVEIAIVMGYGDEKPIAQERKKNYITFLN